MSKGQFKLRNYFSSKETNEIEQNHTSKSSMYNCVGVQTEDYR